MLASAADSFISLPVVTGAPGRLQGRPPPLSTGRTHSPPPLCFVSPPCLHRIMICITSTGVNSRSSSTLLRF